MPCVKLDRSKAEFQKLGWDVQAIPGGISLASRLS